MGNGIEAKRKCLFLAVDAKNGVKDVMDVVSRAAAGPIAPYLAGIKVNDALHAEEGGQVVTKTIMTECPDLYVGIDLKMADVSATVVNTLNHYKAFTDRLLVTVSLNTAAQVFVDIRETFPTITVVAMGIPTDMSVEECQAKHRGTPANVMRRWYGDTKIRYRDGIGQHDGPDDILPSQLAVMSIDMIKTMRRWFPYLGAFTPGIRDPHMAKDHQVRTTGIYAGLEAGITYAVMGAQLTKGNPNQGITAAESQQITASEIERYFALLE